MNNNIVEQMMSYSEKNWYHTVHHVNMLYDLYYKYRSDILKEFTDFNFDKLQTVFEWHDILYIPGNEYNELFSAELYKQLNVKEFDEEIYNCILSTNVKNTIFDTPLKIIMHDLDWFGLSEDYDKFLQDNERIITEAVEKGGYNLSLVIENRKKFLKSLLNKTVYISETFKDRNKLLKKNIRKYLKEQKANK